MKILGMGWPELLIILLVILLIFGPKNLPKLGAAIGKSVKNLRSGLGSAKKSIAPDKPAATEELEAPTWAEGAASEAATAEAAVIAQAVEEVPAAAADSVAAIAQAAEPVVPLAAEQAEEAFSKAEAAIAKAEAAASADGAAQKGTRTVRRVVKRIN